SDVFDLTLTGDGRLMGFSASIPGENRRTCGGPLEAAPSAESSAKQSRETLGPRRSSIAERMVRAFSLSCKRVDIHETLHDLARRRVRRVTHRGLYGPGYRGGDRKGRAGCGFQGIA